MMTIEEAIIHCREMAAGMVDCGCQKDHLQLAEWLEELADRRKARSVVHAHWEKGHKWPGLKHCSACGYCPPDDQYFDTFDNGWLTSEFDFCPGCGAKMDGEVE